MQRCIALVDNVIGGKNLCFEGFALASANHISAYDAMYLAAARRFNATFVSLDQKLLNAAKALNIKVADIEKPA